MAEPKVADPEVKCKKCTTPMTCIYILDIPKAENLVERRTERSYVCPACGKAAVDSGNGGAPKQTGSFEDPTLPKGHGQSLRQLRLARKGFLNAKQGK